MEGQVSKVMQAWLDTAPDWIIEAPDWLNTAPGWMQKVFEWLSNVFYDFFKCFVFDDRYMMFVRGL
jgi:hypothetical protein